MNVLLALTAAATLGVDIGWQPLPRGGYEYTIQIEPEALDSFAKGEIDIASDLPPFLRGVRSYRITVGRGPVPRIGEPPHEQAPPQNEEAAVPGAIENDAGQPSGRDLSSPEDADSSTASLRRPELPDDVDASPDATENLSGAPGVFQPDEPAEEIAKTVAYDDDEQDALSPSHANPGPASDARISDVASGRADARPWWLWTLTLLGLFASLGGNGYLVWIVWELRSRYRSLLSDLNSPTPFGESAA